MKCLTCDTVAAKCGVCKRCYGKLQRAVRKGNETVEQQVTAGKRLSPELGLNRKRAAMAKLGKVK